MSSYQSSYSLAGIFAGENLTTGKANACNKHNIHSSVFEPYTY